MSEPPREITQPLLAFRHQNKNLHRCTSVSKLFNNMAMYSLPPILKTEGPIELPTCMYKLPVIQASDNVQLTCNGSALKVLGIAEFASFITYIRFWYGFQSGPVSLAELESRQERLMTRLNQLQSKVVSVRKDLGLGPSAIMTGANQGSVSEKKRILVETRMGLPSLSSFSVQKEKRMKKTNF